MLKNYALTMSISDVGCRTSLNMFQLQTSSTDKLTLPTDDRFVQLVHKSHFKANNATINILNNGLIKLQRNKTRLATCGSERH